MKKTKIMSIIMILVALIIIGVCAFYLINSKRMINKYNGDSFKLINYDIPTFNSALKDKKKLVYAKDTNNIIILRYDIENIKLNDVYAYLEKLSKEGYVVVNLEDLYIRTVNNEKDIQIKINIGSKHLIFEYKLGIDTIEKIDKKANNNIKKELEKENKEQE